MASYHLSVHPNVSRGKGQSLVRTAAYNDRTRLVDERTGEVWDYRRLGGLLAEGTYAPKDAPDWARDLGQLVNAVEQFEKRSDAQLAMNLDIALPHEQTLEQNRRLMQDFVREQFQRKGYAAHFAIHAPDRDGDERNIHAHVLVTLRQIGPDGFARSKAEQQERYRNRGAYVEGLRDRGDASPTGILSATATTRGSTGARLRIRASSASRSSTKAPPSPPWNARATSPASAIRSADGRTTTPSSRRLPPRNGRSMRRSSTLKRSGRGGSTGGGEGSGRRHPRAGSFSRCLRRSRAGDRTGSEATGAS